MRKSLSLILSGALAAVGAAVPVAFNAATADDLSTQVIPLGTLHIVAIGDSYTAGNGTGEYYGPGDSHRSHLAWSELYVDWLKDQGVHATYANEAWSGATTADILSKQIPNVPSNTGLVVFTAGGNDAGFGDVVKQCFVVGMRDARGCREKVAFAEGQLGTIISSTERILNTLADTLSDNAQIALVGYPLLALDNGYALTDSYGLFRQTETYEAASEVRRVGKKFEQAQQSLVTRWNSSHKLKVTYIASVNDVFSAAPGHEPNAYATQRNDYRWINEFQETAGDVGPDGKTVARGAYVTFYMGNTAHSADDHDWYHPNRIGHRKIKDMLVEQIGIPEAAKDLKTVSGDVDIAFVVDTTGSMANDILAVKAQIGAIVADTQAKTETARFALVSYQDHPSAGGHDDDYPTRTDLQFTTDAAALATALEQALEEVKSGRGGDRPEAVWSGVMQATNLGWRDGVRKLAIVIGDAPPKDPEPVTGYTWQGVAARALEVDPVEVSAIDTGALASGPLFSLVSQTGGSVYTSFSSSSIAAAISASITAALAKPFAYLQGPHLITVGTTLTLDARASYAVDGSLVSYEWDFDGDGIYDQTTTEPMLSHQFDTLMDGVIGVRVTDSAGRTALGSTTIQVTDGQTTATTSSEPAKDKPGVVELRLTKVKASQSTVRLVKGKKMTIAAAAYSQLGTSHPVKFTSGNPKIATVSAKGKITAKKAGRAVITIKAGLKSAKVKVTVVKRKPAGAKVKAVTVKGRVKKLKVGNVAYLTGVWKPAKAVGVKVTYTSSKPKVLAVDKTGRIVGVKKGTAVVKVKAGGKTTKVKITVT